MSKQTTLKAHGRVLAKVKRPLPNKFIKAEHDHIDREEVRVFMEDGYVLMAIFYRPAYCEVYPPMPIGRRRSTGWRVMVQQICTVEKWLNHKLSGHIPPFTQVYPPPQLTLKV